MIDQSHLHPMIIHFPIALIIVGFLFDVVALFTKKHSFATAAVYLIVLGTIGTIAAYLSGDLAGDGVTEIGALGAALETHEEAATLALWTMIIVGSSRLVLAITKKMQGVLQLVMVAFLAFGVATIARTGYYGGELVYRHAAGVQLSIDGLTAPTEASTQTQSPATDDDDD